MEKMEHTVPERLGDGGSYLPKEERLIAAMPMGACELAYRPAFRPSRNHKTNSRSFQC